MSKVIINAVNDCYSTDQIRCTLTVAELIEALQDCDAESPVFLSFDKGYTFGAITESRIEEIGGDE